ncbi:glycoside hydrolase family 20 zincin-like fold domain-containing protein [Pedobacter sp. SYSU D00535]|uniref:glycoside hydrolase family 20 zincin-like fold domain-containing protein n=1 Tax=Pedobacter sp. SYSU D00535 TaxID=2810308 RepID=UPI001A95A530|nr:glycoside hydrolase family 20 zincin-like fold domain-containing protein [Pedobacter sp. SYSU D00535]
MMNKISALFALLELFVVSGFAQDNARNSFLASVGKEEEMEKCGFVVNAETAILFESKEEEQVARLFQEMLKQNYGLDLVLAKAFIKPPASIIRFSSAYTGDAEGYHLTINPDQVNLAAKGDGLLYGTQTLLQLFPAAKSLQLELPCLEVLDQASGEKGNRKAGVQKLYFPQ